MADLDGTSVEIMPEDVRIVESAKGDLTVKTGGGYVVGLDTSLTEELLAGDWYERREIARACTGARDRRRERNGGLEPDRPGVGRRLIRKSG